MPDANLLLSLRRLALLRSAPITAIVFAAALLEGCDNPPQLAESERQYCSILDQFSRDVGDNARAHDSNNPLQREESDKIESQLFQKFNAALHSFFATHSTLDKWAVKLDSSNGIDVNNGIVTVTSKVMCSETPLITSVSKRDDRLVALLSSATTDSYKIVSGSVRQPGYRDSFSVWGWGKPVYITFITSSISAVNDDGTIAREEKSIYPADAGITRAIDAAAANEYRRDAEGKQNFDVKNMQRAYDMIKK